MPDKKAKKITVVSSRETKFPKVVLPYNETEQDLVHLQVKDLSNQQQEFYDTQKEYYQTIANAFPAWHEHQYELLSNSNSYENPWKVDFEIPSCAPETILDGFMTEL